MSIVEKLKRKISSDEHTATDATTNVVSDKPRKEEVSIVKNLIEEEKTALSVLIKKPRVTEKSTDLQKGNIYTFTVQRDSTKPQLKAAVEKLYGVEVLDVRTVNIPRKRRMRGRTEGWKQGYRKAMVKIKEGQTIEVSSS